MTGNRFRKPGGELAEISASLSGLVGGDISPQVSVIIPTYNRAQYIEESIRSVLGQTYADLEVVVVDDGSVDGTDLVVSSIADTRLRYIRQENQGRSAARNHALSIARGKYITFLDSDDLYLPEKIALQVDYLRKHPEVGMIYTSAYCINDRGETLAHRYEATVSGHIYEQIAFFTPVTITLPTVMTYREVLDYVGGFDENMHRFEDTDMWRRISKSYRIDAMPDYTCRLRTHDDNSLLNQNPIQITLALDYYAKKIMRDDEEIDLALRRKGLAGLYRYYGRALLTVPEFESYGKELLRIASGYEWWTDRLRNWFGCFTRIAYYRTLNSLYAVYSRMKSVFTRWVG